jgi:F420H(2)-dependent quinone reductase
VAGDADEWRQWDERIVEANKEIVAEFRSNAGRVQGYFAGAPMLLLHHLGAHTGRERVNPFVYLQDGDDMVVDEDQPCHPDVPVDQSSLVGRAARGPARKGSPMS